MCSENIWSQNQANQVTISKKQGFGPPLQSYKRATSMTKFAPVAKCLGYYGRFITQDQLTVSSAKDKPDVFTKLFAVKSS